MKFEIPMPLKYVVIWRADLAMKARHLFSNVKDEKIQTAFKLLDDELYRWVKEAQTAYEQEAGI